MMKILIFLKSTSALFNFFCCNAVAEEVIFIIRDNAHVSEARTVNQL